MGDEGIGPSTSVLSGQRSATELIAHLIRFILIFSPVLVNKKRAHNKCRGPAAERDDQLRWRFTRPKPHNLVRD